MCSPKGANRRDPADNEVAREYRPSRRIFLQKKDVTSALRQVGVDPGGGENAVYILLNFTVRNLQLQFRRGGSPGWWEERLKTPIEVLQGIRLLYSKPDVKQHTSSAWCWGDCFPRTCGFIERRTARPNDNVRVLIFMDNVIAVEVQ